MADLPVAGPIDLPKELFPSELLGEILVDIRGDLKNLGGKFKEKESLEDLSIGEPGMEAAFSNPIFSSQNNFFAVRVSSVSGSQIYGIRLRPSTDSTSPWMDDSEFSTRPVGAYVPSHFAIPAPGQIVTIQFTGLSSGSSRYGLFSSPGPARYLVKTVGDNTLSCKMLTPSGSETGSEVVIAKPWELRRKSYAGLTISGVTYTYVDAQSRSAVSGDVTESQVITPGYVANQTRITVVQYSNEDNTLSSIGTDLNEGGRAWAVEA